VRLREAPDLVQDLLVFGRHAKEPPVPGGLGNVPLGQQRPVRRQAVIKRGREGVRTVALFGVF